MDRPPDNAIELRGISKAFQGVSALKDVSIHVRTGEIHAVLGENGAGKSTLMKLLNGVYPEGTFAGEIVLGGEQVRFHSPFDARCKGVGYVPQEIAVIEQLSVAENILIGNWTDKGGPLVDFGFLRKRAAQLLAECRIDLDPDSPVSALNASQRQLVMIARALARRLSVLILDEATACLTHHEAQNLFRILRHLQAQGVSCLFITHKLGEIIDLADCATVLRDGTVVARFERGKFNENELVAAMVGRKVETFYPRRNSAIGEDNVLGVEDITVPHPTVAGRNLVENVSFSVRRGEILGIGGLVGSGRSELVNALYGNLPMTGRVIVEGREVRIRRPRDGRSHGMGLVPEERKTQGLLPNFAIRENITLHRLQSVSRRSVINRRLEDRFATEFMARLGIRAPSPATPVMNLSGGNQQKVVLAKALFGCPRILILDEPTKGVDVGTKAEIYTLLMGLVDDGMTLIVISSELPELLALCDRFVVLARGKIVDRFSKAEASEERLMLAATR